MKVKMVTNIWREVEDYIGERNFLLICDRKVYNIYKEDIKGLVDQEKRLYLVDAAEASKSLDQLVPIYQRLLDLSLDREGLIIALGGGVIGDLAGFAAATFKRGIDYIQIPTTLLAQVDSSIGGKTAINFQGVKNLIGSFHFPLVSLIDLNFLKSLEEDEISCGLGEVLKYGLIQDYDLFNFTINHLKEIYEMDLKIVEKIVEKSLGIKNQIYQADRFDRGQRQKLNFGHTVGHAIESLYNYEKYNHGQAVILGMIYESKIALNMKLITRDYYEEINRCLSPLVDKIKFNKDNLEELMNHMRNDKKNHQGKIVFCLPVAKGQVDIFHDIEEGVIISSLLND